MRLMKIKNKHLLLQRKQKESKYISQAKIYLKNRIPYLGETTLVVP